VNVGLDHTIDQRTTLIQKANEKSQISQRKDEQASHTKSICFANMSHEIKSFLTTIFQGFFQLSSMIELYE
jgi:signal transduction histidine kinase